MEQPREPKFYPNEVFLPLNASESTEKTLQSIDSTLKRIEKILLSVWMNNDTSPLQEIKESFAKQFHQREL